MNSKTWLIDNESDMVALGESLGRALARSSQAARAQAVTVFLAGTLGAGKTTLARGILRAFGHLGAVKSPTYTLVEAYEFAQRTLYHFDLYRLGNPEELEYMGIRDYFAAGNLCLIEWPVRGQGVLPVADWELALEVAGSGRRILLQANTATGAELLALVTG